MPKLTHLTRTSILLASFFALDKILAFGKAMLFNKIVGLEGMGIFGAANNIPDYLSALLSGGALGMAFIPVLTEVLDRQGRREAWALFSRILNLAFIVTGVASLVIILLAGPLVRNIIVPNFTPGDQALTISLMRLDLLAILLFSISGLVMAGLQAHQHFLLPALAPILYNLGQIFGVTVLAPDKGLHFGPVALPAFGLGLYGMVYGVILGAALHLLIQVPGLIRYGFRWQPAIGLKTAGVQRVLILLGPRVLTMACIQAYFVARDSLSSFFGTTGVGALNLGWTIEQVPETIIGTAIAVGLLPSLAEFINRGQAADFMKTVNRALRVMLALALPAAALLALAVRPLAASFFGYDATRLDLLTACTWAFLLGLVGDTWLEVAVRSFYANQDTRTPLVAAFLQAVTFLLLSLALRPVIGLAGIPLSAALTFTTQAVILLTLLNRKFPGLLDVGSTALRALPAALLAGLAAFAVMRFLPLSALLSTVLGLIAGGLIALPLIWRELRMLFRL
jgi:putative peptidoglycan lipid II flippase